MSIYTHVIIYYSKWVHVLMYSCTHVLMYSFTVVNEYMSLYTQQRPERSLITRFLRIWPKSFKNPKVHSIVQHLDIDIALSLDPFKIEVDYYLVYKAGENSNKDLILDFYLPIKYSSKKVKIVNWCQAKLILKSPG